MTQNIACNDARLISSVDGVTISMHDFGGTGSPVFLLKPHEVARLGGSLSSQKETTNSHTTLRKWRPDPKGLSGEKPYSLY